MNKVKKPRAVASKHFIRAFIFCLGSHEHLTCLLLFSHKRRENKIAVKNCCIDKNQLSDKINYNIATSCLFLL